MVVENQQEKNEGYSVMLTDKYINALSALKAQYEGRFNDVKDQAQGCEAEAAHIYRIMFAHNAKIVEMNEEILERFMAEEIASGSPYPSPDRDGLKYVDLEKDVKVTPFILTGCFSYPIVDQSYTLLSHEAIIMLSQLTLMGKLCLITETMQSLAVRNDGTPLQTAFPDLVNVTECIKSGLDLPAGLLAKIKEWESLGATRVSFDFVGVDMEDHGGMEDALEREIMALAELTAKK